MKRKPRVIAYTNREGSDWLKWEPEVLCEGVVHSILFQDGSIWDTYNGWRPRSSWYTQLRIRQIRNIWKNK